MMENTQALAILDEMRTRVEALWQAILKAKTEDEKQPIRDEYREAYRAYKRQLLLHPELGTSEPAAEPQDIDSAPEVFRYHDYRVFLLDWLRYLKNQKAVSMRGLTEKAGISADALGQVLKGTKSLSEISFRKLLPHLGLDQSGGKFLEALHTIAETDQPEVRLQAMDRLLGFPLYRKYNPQEYEAWRYLSHWYFVAIREMSTLAGFKADAEWIQEKLRWPVGLPEIRKAIKFLEGAGFFVVKEKGRVESKIKNVNCKGGVFRIALGQFHREMLSIASNSIGRLTSSERTVKGHTTALPKEKYAEACRILDEALEKIAELGAGESSADEIYHIGVFAVPLTGSSGLEKPKP